MAKFYHKNRFSLEDGEINFNHSPSWEQRERPRLDRRFASHHDERRRHQEYVEQDYWHHDDRIPLTPSYNRRSRSPSRSASRSAPRSASSFSPTQHPSLYEARMQDLAATGPRAPNLLQERWVPPVRKQLKHNEKEGLSSEMTMAACQNQTTEGSPSPIHKEAFQETPSIITDPVTESTYDTHLGIANISPIASESPHSAAQQEHSHSNVVTTVKDQNYSNLPVEMNANDPYSSCDSDTDDEEILLFAEKMFGVTPPALLKKRLEQQQEKSDSDYEPGFSDCETWIIHSQALKKPAKKRPRLTIKKKSAVQRRAERELERQLIEQELEAQRAKQERERKEQAKPLTAEQIRAILGEDDSDMACSAHWVRRSMRQPSKAALHSTQTRALLDKLRNNDSDMVVLKMKKYINDPDTPQVVIDAVLDALEENTNCEALFIQNFNEGMQDEQALHLLRVLQRPTCKIWCLNIGETYKIKTKTWKIFAQGLKDTKITHMYASEHTIDGTLKEMIRDTIRANRTKHDMHINPDNLDVIIKCTHCWWNPINAKKLRPYLRKKGFEHILFDTEAQGLPGSQSGATLL